MKIQLTEQKGRKSYLAPATPRRRFARTMKNLVYCTIMGPCKWVELSLHFIRGRSHNLFENEDGSDVILMVGCEGYKERVPVHSWVLAASNQYFRALFQGSLADRNKKTYDINDDPKGFQNLLRWIYRHECGIQNMESALITLQVAIQYLCPDLAEWCAAYIGKNLRESNVLKVLQFMWQYCSSSKTSHDTVISTAPSAPRFELIDGTTQLNNYSICEAENTHLLDATQHTVHSMSHLRELSEEELQDPTACCSDLYNVCLEIVDRATQSVLVSDTLEELGSKTLELILRRPTLNISNELLLFRAVQRWSTAECKRRMLPLTSENKRKVLGDNLYRVRYLTMTKEQLQQTSSLLIADEVNYLATRISGHTPTSVPATLKPHLSTMAVLRHHNPTRTPNAESQTKMKKKNGGKKRYTRKELVLDVVSCLAVIFD